MSTVDRYLLSYVRRRRAVAVLRALLLATAFAISWIALCRWPEFNYGDWFFGVIVGLAIVSQPILFLFRRYDAVAVAIEIEMAEPAFDQRLITLVSQRAHSSFTDQLLAEVMPILMNRQGSLPVRLRPMLLPALAMFCAGCIYWAVSHHFRHIFR